MSEMIGKLNLVPQHIKRTIRRLTICHKAINSHLAQGRLPRGGEGRGGRGGEGRGWEGRGGGRGWEGRGVEGEGSGGGRDDGYTYCNRYVH